MANESDAYALLVEATVNNLPVATSADIVEPSCVMCLAAVLASRKFLNVHGLVSVLSRKSTIQRQKASNAARIARNGSLLVRVWFGNLAGFCIDVAYRCRYYGWWKEDDLSTGWKL